MKRQAECGECFQPLEEWEAGFCENCSAGECEMKSAEAKRLAKTIVVEMLSGRCQPEPEDFRGVAKSDAERESIECEVRNILSRLVKSLS